ncbi:MAG: hypothetical protein ABH954_00215 [Candidatus Omnitrophota bacterium]
MWRRKLVVGLLKEDEAKGERRAPLCPNDVQWLIKHGIEVEVQSSGMRVFDDFQYEKSGARIVDHFRKAKLLVGIKELKIDELLKGKIYMNFSHTIKGQTHNMPLLKEFLRKKVTLIDYETITDAFGKRLVYFGRFAGVCGLVDSFYYLGQKLKLRDIKTPFLSIKPAHEYASYNALKADFENLSRRIKRRGFDKRISPFIVGITGHGNVSRGVQEILDLLYPDEIHPKDMADFIRHQKYVRNKIYKRVFLREEKLRRKQKDGFYFEEYLEHPSRFESNLDLYLPYLNILIHASYWDNKYPRLVSREMISKLYRKRKFRLEFITDISCDINGSIEMTYRPSTMENPTYTYDPKLQEFVDGHAHKGITILARDNLPTELPKDSAEDFSSLIRNYVYDIAIAGTRRITNHSGITREIRGAVITQGGRLTKQYKYLRKYLKSV